MLVKIDNENTKVTRSIAFVVYPQFQIQDLSGPLSAFESANTQHADSPYNLHIVSREGGLVQSSSGLAVATEAIGSTSYHTIIFTGGDVVTSPPVLGFEIDGTFTNSLRTARRVASVCTGAFLLAGAGMLDGRRATTHWKCLAQLQRMYPKVKVDGDRIFTKDGDLWTSAGVTAGIDLALAMIEEDLGSEISRSVARMLVVYHRRPGGQSQFSSLLDMDPATDRVRTVLTFIREHLMETLSTDRLADVAHLSPRQFGRLFRAETGETPAKAVERLRAEVARIRIESGAEPIEVIARHVGFTDPERMRRAFVRIFGHSPQSLRRIAEEQATRAQLMDAHW
jgi:transcriptional regulator GlxA family with amidase domain